MQFQFILLALLLFITGCSAIGKSQWISAKPIIPKIENGELLRFGFYRGSEKWLDHYFASFIKIQSDRTNLKVYFAAVNVSNINPVSKSVQFLGYSCIDLGTASLVEKYEDRRSISNSLSDPGLIQYRYQVDSGRENIRTIKQYWDGNTVRTGRNSVNYKPRYPVWAAEDFVTFGARYFDPSIPGVITLTVPEIIKEPLVAGLKIIKKEKISTPAGNFNTTKIGLQASDPFLKKLMEPFTKKVYFWIEDAPRHLIVKIETPEGDNIVLEEISLLKQEPKIIPEI